MAGWTKQRQRDGNVSIQIQYQLTDKYCSTYRGTSHIDNSNIDRESARANKSSSTASRQCHEMNEGGMLAADAMVGEDLLPREAKRARSESLSVQYLDMIMRVGDYDDAGHFSDQADGRRRRAGIDIVR